MKRGISLADLLQLGPAERILLAQDLWDSISEIPQAVELTDAQRAELDRRLTAYHADETAVLSWDEVRAQVFGK